MVLTGTFAVGAGGSHANLTLTGAGPGPTTAAGKARAQAEAAFIQQCKKNAEDVPFDISLVAPPEVVELTKAVSKGNSTPDQFFYVSDSAGVLFASGVVLHAVSAALTGVCHLCLYYAVWL